MDRCKFSPCPTGHCPLWVRCPVKWKFEPGQKMIRNTQGWLCWRLERRGCSERPSSSLSPWSSCFHHFFLPFLRFSVTFPPHFHHICAVLVVVVATGSLHFYWWLGYVFSNLQSMQLHPNAMALSPVYNGFSPFQFFTIAIPPSFSAYAWMK